jgi:hypothetical protein
MKNKNGHHLKDKTWVNLSKTCSWFWENERLSKHVCLKIMLKEPEAYVNISIVTDLENFFESQDLCLGNIKAFQTCTTEDLDELLK